MLFSFTAHYRLPGYELLAGSSTPPADDIKVQKSGRDWGIRYEWIVDCSNGLKTVKDLRPNDQAPAVRFPAVERTAEDRDKDGH